MVWTIPQAAARDRGFQVTQRPVGSVFGFSVVIDALVGVVIVYQVLATDVADHLKEYATFKAIIYRQRFFLSTVFEKAAILALLGFVPGSAILLGIYALVERFTGLPIAVSVGRLVFVLLGAIAMCMVSGTIVTRRLSRAEPAKLF